MARNGLGLWGYGSTTGRYEGNAFVAVFLVRVRQSAMDDVSVMVGF